MLDRSAVRAASLVALVGPAALVGALRMLDAGPAPAGPAVVVTSATPAVPAAAVSPAPTEEQRRALEFLAQFAPASLLSSPMDHPTPMVERPKPPAEKPEPAATPDTAPPPDAPPPPGPLSGLRLTAILGTLDGGLAAINGRVYRVGDEPLEGWRIEKIDAHAQSVTFTDTAGRSETLRHERELPLR